MAPIAHECRLTFVESLIKDSEVVMVSKTTCVHCGNSKLLLTKLGATFKTVELDQEENGSVLQQALSEKYKHKTVPMIFIGGRFIGGFDDLQNLATKRILVDRIFAAKYSYDLIVIGGGSGGLAASKEAGLLGCRVLCLDYVEPTPLGTAWGLGGTCVNVGCIPKKLMHQSAILSHAMNDAKTFGWNMPDNICHNWETMITGVQNHIGSLNWGYRVALRDKNVEYRNAKASFIDCHTLQLRDRAGNISNVTGDKIVIVTGERPKYLDIAHDRELCITSDDLFSLSYPPGKTLVVGASYVALECAGFLAGLGFDVTVMIRSILLRGFDQEMAEMVGAYMLSHGIKFIRGYIPVCLKRIKDGKPGLIRVTGRPTQGPGDEVVDEYNTVLLAIGRYSCTGGLGLENVSVLLDKQGRIITNDLDQSNIPNIYAIGDVASGRPQLTPVAIQAGKLLARRLVDGASEKMDYDTIPTTVFTPLEYGAIGLSEEMAIEKYGQQDIVVYHTNFKPLEWTVANREDNACYAKIVCVSSQRERVVGLHVLSPNAGEITQGFIVGIRMGATKHDFDSSLGIHPTCAEVFTTMRITKASGESPAQTGC